MSFRVLFFFLLTQTLWAANYIWPLSNSTTPDAMNTSFGPRINYSNWDMHPGMDLPAPLGAALYNSRAGTVFLSGPAGTDGYNNRHVSVQTTDPVDGTLYMIYMHLNSIDSAVTVGAAVTQGQVIGTVGMDAATYTHCHFEFRLGSPFQYYCVHPIKYLPYVNTLNFTAPVSDRFNRKGGNMAARLLFDAPDKNEGDLIRVEVDLKQGASLLSTRVVNFNDRSTIPAFLPLNGGDPDLFTNDIGVEGYQTSNMFLDGRTDLKEGVLVRNLPPACDTLVARVYDMGGNISTSVPLPVVPHAAVSQFLDFEDGLMPPAGWAAVTSTTGTGTSVSNTNPSFHTGSRGMFSQDLSTSEVSTQRAGIEFPLPANRFEWLGEAWVEPVQVPVPGQDTYPIAFFTSGGNLSVSARIRNQGTSILAGITAKRPDGTLTGIDSSQVIGAGVWHKWTMTVSRIGTRETTAVLYLDVVEAARLDWDSGTYEPQVFRAGIALNGAGTTAELNEDEVRVYEDTDEMLPPTATPTSTGTLPPTATPTLTPTTGASTATATTTNSQTNTPSFSPTNTLTFSPSITSTASPTQTETNSPTKTPTNTPSTTPTNTATPTFTLSNVPTFTQTFTLSPTPTPPAGENLPFPNPWNGVNALVFYHTVGPNVEKTVMKLLTTSYRKVFEDSSLAANAGQHLYTLDLNKAGNIANGLYYLVLTEESGGVKNITVLKILLLR